MSIAAEVQRARDALPCAVLADGLRRRQDVRFVEAAVLRRAAVPAGPERHLLLGVLGIRTHAVVGSEQLFRID